MPPVADESGAYGKTQGAIPAILLGPKLNLVALPPGIGLEAKLLGNSLGLSLDGEVSARGGRGEEQDAEEARTREKLPRALGRAAP